MDRAQDRHVYKYFEPQDRFVRILVAPDEPRRIAERIGFGERRGTSGEAYRRALVELFVPEAPELEHERPGCADDLFALVVDVNPELSLANVRFDASATGGTSASAESDAPTSTSARRPGRRGGRDAEDGFRRRLRALAGDAEARLARSVVGQPGAIEAAGRVVRRAALGWDRRGPHGSLLLVGPTGTGKTELAKTLARELGGEDLLIRVDCTEFGEGHEYAKLIGAPPGYVGHAEGGVLSRGLERAPRAVVLFDEIEKAHERVHHLLLQILDEGFVTDGRGVRLDLSECFVLLTSNAGTRELARAAERIGFGDARLPRSTRTEIVRSELAQGFRPEFLARLDEIVVFDELTADTARRIAAARLTDLAASARRGHRSGPRVRFTGAVGRWIAERGMAQGEGARGIVHAIRREIEAPLAALAVARDTARWIDVSIRAGRPHFVKRDD